MSFVSVLARSCPEWFRKVVAPPDMWSDLVRDVLYIIVVSPRLTLTPLLKLRNGFCYGVTVVHILPREGVYGK